MKRTVLAAIAAVLIWHTTALAQEQEPLVMRISFEWTTLGLVGGAVVGAAIWLTDPANPNNSLSRQAIEGAALGAAAGFGFSIYVMQNTARIPAPLAFRPGPLDPSQRLNTDPLLAETPLTFGSLAHAGGGGRAFTLPLLNLRF